MGESIERQLGRMDANIAQLLEIAQNDAESRKEIYRRLNSLERWQAGVIAAGSTLGAIFGFLVGYVKVKFGGGN